MMRHATEDGLHGLLIIGLLGLLILLLTFGAAWAGRNTDRGDDK